MGVINYREFAPRIDPSAFLAPDSWVIGKVSLARDVSVFFGAVLRGDIEEISVGSESNIQEHAVLHTSTGVSGCYVGERVTVGHRAILHSCRLEGDAIIGMGSTVLDGAVVGRNCIIGANSLLSINSRIPDGTLAFGSPAKVIRDLRADEIERIQTSAKHYVEKGIEYRRIFQPHK